MKIRVVVAEDNSFLAQSIKEKLELFPEQIEYKYTAVNGKELLEMLERDHTVDVILMDIEMPIMDGIEATAKVAEKYPQIKIVIQTVFDDEQKIYNAIQAGAMGYLLKDEPPQKVCEAITTIMEGGASMSRSVMAKSLKLLRNPEIVNQPENRNFGLSPREIEVLRQISQGLDYKGISRNLFISPSTVRKHIENIYRKLEVNNKMLAVKKALQNKIF